MQHDRGQKQHSDMRCLEEDRRQVDGRQDIVNYHARERWASSRNFPSRPRHDAQCEQRHLGEGRRRPDQRPIGLPQAVVG